MTACCDENLIAEIISNEFVFSHGHLGKPGSIELVIDSIYIIRSIQVLEFHQPKRKH